MRGAADAAAFQWSSLGSTEQNKIEQNAGIFKGNLTYHLMTIKNCKMQHSGSKDLSECVWLWWWCMKGQKISRRNFLRGFHHASCSYFTAKTVTGVCCWMTILISNSTQYCKLAAFLQCASISALTTKSKRDCYGAHPTMWLLECLV